MNPKLLKVLVVLATLVGATFALRSQPASPPPPEGSARPPAVASGTNARGCPADPSNRLAGDPPLSSHPTFSGGSSRSGDPHRACAQCHIRRTDESGTAIGESKVKSERCLGFLKFIGLSARTWATNHNGVMPSDFASMTNGTRYRLTTPVLLFCSGDMTNKPPANWAEFNPAKTPYQLVSPGTSSDNSSAVYVRCTLHGNELLVDGSVVAATPKR